MTEKQTQEKLQEQGYTGKVNEIYESKDDGNTYFDVTPGFFQKIMRSFGKKEHKGFSVTPEKKDPEA